VKRATRLGALWIVAAVLTASLAGPVSAGSASGIRVRQILNGYDRPILVTNDGSSNRLYIVEQTGRIKIARREGGAWRKLGVFLDLTALVSNPATDGAERGLLGLTFDPRPGRRNLLYVNYTRTGDGATVIAEYRWSGRRADPSTGRVVLTIDQPYPNHNGGNIAFAPDGLLYIGMGDGGAGGDPQDRAQDLSTPLGKMLRIDPANPPGPARYSIPAGNPFQGPGEEPTIWGLGLRNPWRWSFDRLNGNLWIGDVGQGAGGSPASGYEEINRSRATGQRNAGRAINYGWNLCEGRHQYTGSYNPLPPPCTVHTLPVIEQPHDAVGPDNRAIVGGFVHRGPDDPDWRGTYVYADTYSGRVWAVRAATIQQLDVVETGRFITSFGEDVAGRLFLTTFDDGAVLRLRFSGTPPG
jgi:glucose/arabinose dehydrogenase